MTGTSLVDQAIDKLPGVFYLFSEHMEIVRWNAGLAAATGIPESAISGMGPLDFIDAADHASVNRAIGRALSQGEATVEARLLSSGEASAPHLFTARLLVSGGTRYIVGHGVDLSDRTEAETALRESEARLRSFIDNTTEGVYSFEPQSPVPVHLPAEEQIERFYDGCIVDCNRAMAAMYGLDDEKQLIGLTLEEAHGSRDDPANLAFLRQVIESGYRVANVESREVDANGRTVWFANSVVGVIEDGALVRVWGSQTDITERKEAEQRLRLSASVFENTHEGVIIMDRDWRIIDVNPAFLRITGFDRADVVGRNSRAFRTGDQDDEFFLRMRQHLRDSGVWRGEVWNRRKDGSVYPQQLTISSVISDSGALTHYVVVFSDITQLKRSQEQLEFLAHNDVLTKLPNRVLLQERLRHAVTQVVRRGDHLVVVCLDLDRFKNINDSLGHSRGDELLAAVGEALTEALRADDTVARVGGDEFVLLFEGIAEADGAARIGDKLLTLFERPFTVDAREIRLTASMGICVCPRDGTDADELLRNAEAAMYRAKEAGRNNYHFYTERLTREAHRRLTLINDMRRGLEHDEFSLVFQPQIALASESIVGMEALLRWSHPEHAQVSPAEFIPLAEDSGLIHPIGRWVLMTACEQARRWLDGGFAFGKVAVNVAGPQIQLGTLANEVNAALEASGLPARYLELEVTESFIMQQADSAISQLQALRERGITLAIDDFGTGYSSLSYLKSLPVQKLKLDKSFVRDIPADSNDMAISAAVVAMAGSLGLTVIAEGVETPAQRDFLREQGCSEVQGFLYGRPAPAEHWPGAFG
ncbi:EAL domain-containing protein [Ectothiorhodospiraceae bacterium WFHF3C12]|nr:EAL domain-containing protein [Ectothiorhodospiraceae bacterium WFHF3C12]